MISLKVKDFKQDDRGRDSMPGGRRVRTYVTPKLPAASAVELLAMHERIAHGSNASAVVNVKPEKFPRPNVGLDEPIEKWEDFTSS